jgi:deoxyadenosine/deoxycytidine kinase
MVKPVVSRLVVEVVGIAGAGKTTLLSVLGQKDKTILTLPSFRRLQYVPHFACSILTLLPTFLRQYTRGQRFTRKQIVWMTRLKATHRILNPQAFNHHRVIVLDRGPVYMLTRLLESISTSTSTRSFENWWNSMIKTSAAALDVIIWLDAPDETLMERVLNRGKWHKIKDKSDQEARDYLANYRALYEQVIAELTGPDHPKVLYYDTSRHSVAQIVDRALSLFELDTCVDCDRNPARG